MTFAAYVAEPGVNWSTLKHLRTSPLAYRHALTAPNEDTVSRLKGRVLHTLVLEPETFGDLYGVWDGKRRGTNDYKAFEEHHKALGRAVIKENELDLVRAQAAAVRAHPAAMRVLEGQHEVAMTWADSATGIACKGLADSLSPDWLADLKGCGGLALFERLAIRDGYHLQLAWYLRGARARGLDPRPCLVGVETKAPHDVGVFLLSDALLAEAERELSALVARLVECRERDEWPGAYPEPVEMALPAWMLSDEIEIETEEVTGE
jgi:hypothetical protein